MNRDVFVFVPTTEQYVVPTEFNWSLQCEVFLQYAILFQSLRQSKLRGRFDADRRDTFSERQMTTTELDKVVSYNNFRKT